MIDKLVKVLLGKIVYISKSIASMNPLALRGINEYQWEFIVNIHNQFQLLSFSFVSQMQLFSTVYI